MSRTPDASGEAVRTPRGRGGYDEYFLPAPETEQTGRSWRETVAGRSHGPVRPLPEAGEPSAARDGVSGHPAPASPPDPAEAGSAGSAPPGHVPGSGPAGPQQNSAWSQLREEAFAARPHSSSPGYGAGDDKGQHPRPGGVPAGARRSDSGNAQADFAALGADDHRPSPQMAVPGAAYTPVAPVGSVPPPPPPPSPEPDTGHVYRPLPDGGAAQIAAQKPAVAPIPAPPPILTAQSLPAVQQGFRPVAAAATGEPPFPLSFTLTTDELLADITARRRAQLRSTTGMRGALNRVGFQLGLSAAEQRTELRRGRIRRQLVDYCQIAVVSVKGGVGRTTVAGALGATFAAVRPDRVVAVDANPDFGDLASRTSRHPYGLTLRDLAQASHVDAFSAVQSFTSMTPSDLAVVASPWTSAAVEPLSGAEFVAGVAVLRRHYNLSVIDCGTGVLDSVTDTVLRTSDAVVVVTPATVRGVTGAIATLEWLNSHGLHRLAGTSTIAIVHNHPARPVVEIERIEELFATANRPTFRVPYDEHLAEGSEIDLRLLDKETALAFEELAAALADGFPGDHTGPDRGGRW